MEVYVLVQVRKSFATVFCSVLSLVAAVGLLALSCITPMMAPLAIVFGLLWYFLMFRANKEYEYSYFDGEARFARVMNKSRRKALGSYSMDEIVMIAPSGDRSVSKYEGDHSIKVCDYTSHMKRPYYVMVAQKGGNLTLIKFEPDEQYLDAVAFKFRQKVVR